MATKSNTGPGRAQRKGSSADGRAQAKGGAPSSTSKVGRYKTATESGKYTPPVPRSVHHSPRWLGVTVLSLLFAGVLMILLNYLTVLPGSVSSWYLLGGLVVIFAGFIMATRYR